MAQARTSGDTYRLTVALNHELSLDDADLYDEIIQSYKARILCWRDDREILAGTFDFYVANVALAMSKGIDVVDVADSLDGDLEEYCGALFKPTTASELRAEVIEQFDYPMGGRMLMLHLAKVLPEFRGLNLGLVTARKIIEQFGDGLVVAKPVPLQHHDGFNNEKKMQYERFESAPRAALTRLTRHWRRLGFEPIADTGCLGLNTANRLPEPKLRIGKTSQVPRRAGRRRRS